MFRESHQGAEASTVFGGRSSFERSPDPQPRYETLRHMLFGSPAAVENTIKLLYKLNYAEPNDWSKPMPTEVPNEVVAVLTRKVRV
ncbi:MAG: hypothetical protein AAGD25_41110 [Cyanobacteria bacterium P01_F01_bin.150]